MSGAFSAYLIRDSDTYCANCSWIVGSSLWNRIHEYPPSPYPQNPCGHTGPPHLSTMRPKTKKDENRQVEAKV